MLIFPLKKEWTEKTVEARQKEERGNMKFIHKQSTLFTDIFQQTHEWCRRDEANRHISEGDQIIIPTFYIPQTSCKGENFDEINLKDVVVTAVHVEKSRVVFNFDDILFLHDIDSECSVKPFDETPLGVYLAKHFADAFKEYTGNVKVSLLSRENVFDETSADFMPYFKPIKNRIKVLVDKNDTWYWWLKTPLASYSSNFCLVHYDGDSNISTANTDCGVAPAFEIKE